MQFTCRSDPSGPILHSPGRIPSCSMPERDRTGRDRRPHHHGDEDRRQPDGDRAAEGTLHDTTSRCPVLTQDRGLVQSRWLTRCAQTRSRFTLRKRCSTTAVGARAMGEAMKRLGIVVVSATLWLRWLPRRHRPRRSPRRRASRFRSSTGGAARGIRGSTARASGCRSTTATSGPTVPIAITRLPASKPAQRGARSSRTRAARAGVGFIQAVGRFLFSDQVRARFDIIGSIRAASRAAGRSSASRRSRSSSAWSRSRRSPFP